jgi:hypothetical protein
MKTIIDWLIELKEPYRTQAIRNADRSLYGNMVKSASIAISTAFNWKDTPEGYNYWSKVNIDVLYKRGHCN